MLTFAPHEHNYRFRRAGVKTLFPILAAVLASYLALVWAVQNIGTVSGALCNSEFTLPAIVCSVAGLGITVLLVPLAGIVAFLAARAVLAKS